MNDDAQKLNIKEKLRQSLNAAIKSSPLTRGQIADEMTKIVGIPVTKTILYSWTAKSKTGWRIPAEYLPAFCQITGDYTPLKVLNEACDRVALSKADAVRCEIKRREEKLAAERAEIKKMTLFLKEMEKGR
ncbi:MAG: hypothetical protein JRJ54_14625 [Deltaproteobacteria bacterium]|nr:hypothetical protein [Deltaproteobacteria bacterium]